jgi:hypothetical protein
MALRFLSSCMSRYRLVDQRVLGKCLSLAAAQLMAELLSGKAPTTKRGLVTFVINPDRVGFAHAFGCDQDRSPVKLSAALTMLVRGCLIR